MQRKLISFDPSYRRDFDGFCVCKVERDPPLKLTLPIMEWEGTKNGGRIGARGMTEGYSSEQTQ